MQPGQTGNGNKPLFRGVGAALPTLFDGHGGLLPEDTAGLAAKLVERGICAVLVSGSTGEPWALSAHDRIALCQTVRNRVPSGVPILLGTGAFKGWEETEQMTRECADAGADVFLIMPPPGIPADAAHYQRLRDIAGSTPIWAYHVPDVSAPGVPVDVAPKLDVVAMKDSSGDADRLAAEVVARSDRPIYVGSPTVLTLARALGLPGAILALGNTVPELCNAAFDGDLTPRPRSRACTSHRWSTSRPGSSAPSPRPTELRRQRGQFPASGNRRTPASGSASVSDRSAGGRPD